MVQSWFANHFHPHVHHFTYIMDWQRAAGSKVTHADYKAAAVQAEGALTALLQHQQQQEVQQQQQAGESPQQQHQQQLSEQQDQQVQQQLPEHVAAAAAAAVAGGKLQFWLPDTTGLDTTRPPDDALHEVVGQYVLDGMMQPQRDPSAGPIFEARSDPRGKVVSLESCVEAFLQPEQLSEADEWYCPKCKTHVQVSRTAGAACMHACLAVCTDLTMYMDAYVMAAGGLPNHPPLNRRSVHDSSLFRVTGWVCWDQACSDAGKPLHMACLRLANMPDQLGAFETVCHQAGTY